MKLLIAFALLPALANAAEQKRPIITVTCPDIELLQQNSTQECDDNGRIAQVGVDCYQAFRGVVKSNAAATQLGMQALNAASTANQGNGQSQKFANSVADLSASEASLTALIAAGQQARASVDTYLHGIFLPEDYNMEDDDFQEVYGSADEFLDGEPCFYDNEQGLKGLLKKFDDDLAQLAKTKAAVTAMRATNSVHVTDTTSLNAAIPNSTARRIASPAPVGHGTPKASSSSITGVEQDRAKQQKQP